MTAHTVQLGTPAGHRSFRLTSPQVRTEQRADVVFTTAQAHNLLATARRQDVAQGGCLSPGPAGIQVWDGPWSGGHPGTAVHLGSVDWSWDTPGMGYATVYRVLLTAPGHAAGLTTSGLLDVILSLGGLRPLQSYLPMPRRSP